MTNGRTMFRALAALLVVTAVASLGCSSKGTIHVDAIETLVMKVSERHDRYVTTDPTLVESEKADFLRSTEILRKVIEAAKASAKPPTGVGSGSSSMSAPAPASSSSDCGLLPMRRDSRGLFSAAPVARSGPSSASHTPPLSRTPSAAGTSTPSRPMLN